MQERARRIARDFASARRGNNLDFSALLRVALKRAGKHETLAVALDLSPSVLSRRLNGENNWSEAEINRLLDYVGCEITDSAETSAKIRAMKETMKILLNEE